MHDVKCESTEGRAFSRRSIVKLAAWAVPVAMVATATPAGAAESQFQFTPPAVGFSAGAPQTIRVEAVGEAARAGKFVRVTLPQGYLFAGSGATSKNLFFDSAQRLEFDVVADAAAAPGELAIALVSNPAISGTLAFSVSAAVDEGRKTVDVSDASSSVRLRAHEPAVVAARRENRSFAHSDLQPTGRLVRAGDKVTVSGAAAGAVSVAIGLYGVFADFNGGATVDVPTLPGAGATFTVTAPHDGMVYVVNNSETEQRVHVAGGAPVPVFVLGETTTDDLKAQLAARRNAPFVTVVSDRVFGDFRVGMITQNVERVEAVATAWDDVVAETDRVYGLIGGAGGLAGVAQKARHRIYITNPDTGAGYASATTSRLSFQVDTGAGADLFRKERNDQWGLWHEIGHTYQTPQYKWAGMTEVTVNISAAAIQDAKGWGSRLDTPGIRSAFAKFRATPIGARDFDGLDDLFLRLLMFDQLRRAFGEDFYPRLNQEYRVLTALGRQVRSDAAAQKQEFIRLASAVAGRNLTPFFREWGIAPDAETTSAITSLRALEAPIWENIDRKTDVRIDSVRAYVLPVGAASTASTSLLLGQTAAPAITVGGLATANGQGTARVESTAATFIGSPIVATAAAVLVSDVGVRNVLTLPQQLDRGTSVEIRGVGDALGAWFALDAGSGTIRAVSTGTKLHSVFAGKVYAAVTVTPPGGAPVRHVVDGGGNADALAVALNGTPYREGTLITLEHEEPKNRLLRWSKGVQVALSTVKLQKFRVSGGLLVAA